MVCACFGDGRESWVRLEGKGRVRRRARLDECGGQSIDRRRVEGLWVKVSDGQDRLPVRTYSSVGVGRCNLADCNTLQRRVQSLGDQNGACDGQVVLASNQGGTAKVGRSAHAFEDRGESDEALNIGVREGVVASLDRCDTGVRQSTGKKLHMLLLVVRNVLEVGIVVLAVPCMVVSAMA